LVAEVAIALAASEVEVEGDGEARERSEGKAHRVGAESRDAARVVVLYVLLDAVLVLAFQEAGRGLFDELCQRNSVDEIERVEGVALRLRHLLALGVTHDGVD